MRGDLIINKNTVTDITKFTSAQIAGANIAGTDNPNAISVKQRQSAKSVRISVGSDTVKVVGEGPIRLVMSMNRVPGGGKVYKMIPAGGKPAHGEIRVRN